jgi:hypothetical protein
MLGYRTGSMNEVLSAEDKTVWGKTIAKEKISIDKVYRAERFINKL